MYSTTICLLGLVAFSPLIDAKLILKVVLNDGKLPTDTKAFCNANDLKEMLKVLELAEIAGLSDLFYDIQPITYPIVNTVTSIMNVASSSMSSFTSSTTTSTSTGRSSGWFGFGKRDLVTYAPKCKENCRGYATGTCLAKDCKGYRRTLRQSNRNVGFMPSNQERQCSDGIADLTTSIKELIPLLSNDCRPIVQSKMSVTCFDDIRYAQVDSFTFWNATTGAAIQEKVKNGDTFCSKDNVNIEAVANACVEKITLRLQGQFSKTNDIIGVGPYTIFGITNNAYNGNKLPVGSYTLNTELPGSLQPQSSLSFSIKNC